MSGTDDQSWTPREKRHRTVLPARLRTGLRWNDACILNISSRGLLIHCDSGIDPGSSIVVRRGQQTVIARVVWRNNRRVGLRSDHPISIEALVSNDVAEAPLAAIPAMEPAGHRAIRRTADRNRTRARAMEFLALVVTGTMLAGVAGAYALKTLGQPLQRIEATLEAR